MALKPINPYYSLLNHIFYFRLLYALLVSISIKPIIYIISLISYSSYFNQIEISVIIAIIDIIVGTPSCNMLSHPLAFITYRGTSQKPTKLARIDKPHPASVPWTPCDRQALPEKRLRRWCGMVPVSQTGTTGSFPRILSMGMT